MEFYCNDRKRVEKFEMAGITENIVLRNNIVYWK